MHFGTPLKVPRKKAEFYQDFMTLYWQDEANCGLSDYENYRDYALNRILDYEKQGIFPGDKLILTHETLNNPINSKIIEKTIPALSFAPLFSIEQEANMRIN